MKVPDLHRWMAAICADPELKRAAKTIATRLALHMNSLTGQCNPSISTLAQGCATTSRTVERSIKELEDAGWILRFQAGGQSSNRYALTFRQPAPEMFGDDRPPTPTSGVEEDTPDIHVGPPPTHMSDDPRRGCRTNGEENYEENGEVSIRLQNIGSAVQDSIPPDGFDEFWRAYPLRKARQAAERAYLKARNGGARAEQILEGARRYGSERSREDPKYTKHPATWLNGGCWDDEISPAGSASARTAKRDSRTREAMRSALNHAGYFDHEDDRDELGQQGHIATG